MYLMWTFQLLPPLFHSTSETVPFVLFLSSNQIIKSIYIIQLDNYKDGVWIVLRLKWLLYVGFIIMLDAFHDGWINVSISELS